MKPTIGLIVMGLMGRPMALNVLKAGHPLWVYNRSAAKADDVVKAGALRAETPRQLAAECELVLCIVSDPPAVEACLWGADGALAGLRPGTVLVDSSTVSPALACRTAAACAERQASFLDAPVTGGTWGAEKGELVFMVGGELAVLERVKPLLSTMGKRFFHLGPHGSGQAVKLGMNLILALQVGALAEALALVARAGVEPSKLVEVLQSSMARAPVLDIKAPLMLERRFEPSFPLRLMHKDLGLALELANGLGVPLPTTAAAREIYSAVKGSHAGDVDYAAVADFWHRPGRT
jgi:3-hydroxyisobutyrate dehydrogenase-like beta-hydroxyacid dehydrogenase